MKQDMIIAISGKSGCGNSTVSRLVADRLDLKLINYTFHTMAEEENIPFKKLCEMAEEDPKWDLKLDRKQVELAKEGHCVLGSRLAIWLCKDADLTVYLEASLEERARRIQKREGGRYEEVLEETAERDRRDHQRYMKLYNLDNNNFDFVDLIIKTDDMKPEEIAERIEEEARRIPS